MSKQCSTNLQKFNLRHDVYVSDTKAEANYFLWEKNLVCRIKGQNTRKRPQPNHKDLEHELEIKAEKIQRMEKSLNKIQDRIRDEVVEEIDMEEYEELLNTDEELSDGKSQKFFFSHYD